MTNKVENKILVKPKLKCHEALIAHMFLRHQSLCLVFTFAILPSTNERCFLRAGAKGCWVRPTLRGAWYGMTNESLHLSFLTYNRGTYYGRTKGEKGDWRPNGHMLAVHLHIDRQTGCHKHSVPLSNPSQPPPQPS